MSRRQRSKSLEQMDGRIDAAVIGVGSAGTFTGLRDALKKKLPHVLMVAVETQGSVLQGGFRGCTGSKELAFPAIPATLIAAC